MKLIMIEAYVIASLLSLSYAATVDRSPSHTPPCLSTQLRDHSHGYVVQAGTKKPSLSGVGQNQQSSRNGTNSTECPGFVVDTRNTSQRSSSYSSLPDETCSLKSHSVKLYNGDCVLVVTPKVYYCYCVHKSTVCEQSVF